MLIKILAMALRHMSQPSISVSNNHSKLDAIYKDAIVMGL